MTPETPIRDYVAERAFSKAPRTCSPPLPHQFSAGFAERARGDRSTPEFRQTDRALTRGNFYFVQSVAAFALPPAYPSTCRRRTDRRCGRHVQAPAESLLERMQNISQAHLAQSHSPIVPPIAVSNKSLHQ